MAGYTNAWGGWESAVLKAGGWPDTPQNRAALQMWHQFEGSNASFNPLNTTRVAPNLHGSNYNSAGVKNYPNVQEGIAATVGALKNGYYPQIVKALTQGNVDLSHFGQLVVNSPWGTKHWGTQLAPEQLMPGQQKTGGTPAPTLPPAQAATIAKAAPATANPAQVLLSYLKTQNQKIAAGQTFRPNAAPLFSALKKAQSQAPVLPTAQQKQLAAAPQQQTLGGTAAAHGAITAAIKYLGTKYVFGGNNPKTGFDCSGIAQYVYGLQGIKLPRTTWDQAKVGVAVGMGNLQPGDLVFFHTENDPRGPATHEGIYLGNGQFLHAPHTGDVVKVSSLSDPYYKQRFVVGRRVAG